MTEVRVRTPKRWCYAWAGVQCAAMATASGVFCALHGSDVGGHFIC